MSNNENWTTVIKAQSGWFDFNVKEIYKYKDLIFLFVKRNFSVQYKQTILGPLWFILNPLLTTFMYTLIFGNIAGLSTDGVPHFVFYLTSYSIWLYFSACITQTSNIFVDNADVFGKVYFPRITMPIATVIYALVNFGVVFALALATIVYYRLMGVEICPNRYILILPILIMQTAVLGLGFGIIISSLTTKYRDLTVLVGFGVQLWMYATPVVYPINTIPDVLRKIVMLNPISPVVNNFRYVILGSGQFETGYWYISIVTSVVVLCLGIILFTKVEKTFMDTV